MRNAKFKSIVPDYKRRVLKIVLQEGKKNSTYYLPFSVFIGEDIRSIGVRNKFKKISIDKELFGLAASFILEDGSYGDFPSDFVLYHCDPTYDWSPLNQIRMVIRGKMKLSQLSIRVVADALRTSPAQVMRLLKENTASKQLSQLFQLAELVGCKIEINIKDKTSAKST